MILKAQMCKWFKWCYKAIWLTFQVYLLENINALICEITEKSIKKTMVATKKLALWECAMKRT